jgi:predicted acylesterase/phospholipase RssA
VTRLQIALCLPGCATHIGTVAGFADGVNGRGSVEPIADVVAVAGASGGAAKAAHIAFGGDPDQFMALVSEALQGNRLLDASIAIGDGGVFGGRVLWDLLHDVFGARTMGEAAIPLVIGATRLGRGPVYVTRSTHPRARVARVLHKSMSVPGVFPFAEEPDIGPGLYTDLGVSDNTVDAAFDRSAFPRLAPRLLGGDITPRLGDHMSLAVGLVQSMLWQSSQIKSRRKDGLIVDVHAIGSAFDFDLSPAEGVRRYQSGYSAALAARDRIEAMGRPT